MLLEVLIIALSLAAVALLLAAVRWLSDANAAAQNAMKEQTERHYSQLTRDIMQEGVPERIQRWHVQGLGLGTLAALFAFVASYLTGSIESMIIMALFIFAGGASFTRCMLRLRAMGRKLF